MRSWYYKSQKKWQKPFINSVFEKKSSKCNTFSKIILDQPELLDTKNGYYPKSLFKFFAPTSENIIDLKKQRLWFSHPNSFNDPFDCHTGYDPTSYEKHLFIEHIQNTGFDKSDNSRDGFTEDDLNRVYRSETDYEGNWYRNNEMFWEALSKISQTKDKEFQDLIYTLNKRFKEDVENKIKKLREVNTRVACFSDLKSGNFPPRVNDFEFMIQMWSHYADNHKGFCVEYDLAPLHPEKLLPLKHKYASEDLEAYESEKTELLLSAGLLPIIYTSSRVNIPKTKLKAIRLDKDGNLKINSDVDSLLYKTYIVKSAKWNYEKEWRIILDGDICTYFDNKISFPYAKKIYLGCKMSADNIDILVEIAEELKIEVVIMEMNNKKFYLEPESIDSYKWDKKRKKWNSPLY